jgi:cyclopropane fatty-acyl-phospholipid synthase-like methyltransferase
VIDRRSRLVADGYDHMAGAWEDFAEAVVSDPRAEWLDELMSRLDPGSRVVELGCGNGPVETLALAKHHRLVGVDLSSEQLSKARLRVPAATFVEADILEVEFEPGSLDAVASFYVFNHIPRERLAELLGRIHGWLRPGGLLLAAFGTSDLEGWEGEWLGVPMFFSSFLPAENSRIVGMAGFELLRDEVVEIAEPEGDVAFQWVLAERRR